MDSLMFTFSADQMSMQLGLGHKLHQSSSKSFKRRPSSSKTSNHEKSRIPSFNQNQLFENCHIDNETVNQSPEKSLNNLRIKNTSIQIQQKRKLRNIIDNMLGKNFETANSAKMDSIVISNRKNINRHRGYLNGSRKLQEKQTQLQEKESKQNQFNLQNMNLKPQFEIGQSLNDKKVKPSLKNKKFQFANIKINKMAHHSQRYPDLSKDQESENFDRKLVNISRESIDGDSLGKRVLRAKTPKIMYPQSDSKLPSVFRNHNVRCSLGQSLKKRTRISSAHFISDNDDRKNEDLVLLQKKKTLQNPPMLDPLIKSKARPQSTMLESKRYSTASEKNEQNAHSQFYPKKLVFDCNQQLCEGIAKKLGSSKVEANNMAARVSTRAKSTHINYVHRKLRQINTLVYEPSGFANQQKICAKNQSHHSRQTAEASDMQESIDRTIPNFSDRFSKSIEEKQSMLVGGLGYCVTFQAQKE